MRTAIPRLKELAREEIEKGAKLVSVYRVSKRTLMTRGMLPDLRISVITVPYLVCVFRGEELRIYFCDELGRAVAGDNLRGEEVLDFVKKVSSCRLLFSLQKG